MKRLLDNIKTWLFMILWWIGWTVFCGGFSLVYNFFEGYDNYTAVKESFLAGGIVGVYSFFPLMFLFVNLSDPKMARKRY